MRLRKGCPARLLCPGDRRRGVLVEVCRDIPAMVFCVFAAGQLPANASTETVRVVKYGQDDVVTVHAKVRYVRPGNSTEYPPRHSPCSCGSHKRFKNCCGKHVYSPKRMRRTTPKSREECWLEFGTIISNRLRIRRLVTHGSPTPKGKT